MNSTEEKFVQLLPQYIAKRIANLLTGNRAKQIQIKKLYRQSKMKVGSPLIAIFFLLDCFYLTLSTEQSCRVLGSTTQTRSSERVWAAAPLNTL